MSETSADFDQADEADDDFAPRPVAAWERTLAGTAGAVVGGAGLVAAFATDNEIGTAALLLVGAVFLLISIGFTPTSLKTGGTQIGWSRVAQRVLRERLQRGDSASNDALVERLEHQASKVDPELAVASMIARFARFSDSRDPVEVHDTLLREGWQPRLPPKSAYVRWIYRNSDGKKTTLFQNSLDLVTASNDIRDFAARLEGARPRAERKEVNFRYAENLDQALAAAAAIKRFADGFEAEAPHA